MNWKDYILFLRKLETDIAFQEYEEEQFDSVLELGAGSGAQSKMIKKYAKNLISTDLDANRLKYRGVVDGIKYEICDAERADEYFLKNSFDLVFASNLFEHLPSPQNALNGIREVLKEDGLVILIMPSPFWAIQRYLLHYPFLMFRFFVKRNEKKPKVNKQIFEKSIEVGITNVNRGNNLKAEKYRKTKLMKKIRWPEPHGVSKSNYRELLDFRKKHWLRIFDEANYNLIDIKKGPVMSGRGFGLNNIRHFLGKLGLTGEYIYYLKKSTKDKD